MLNKWSIKDFILPEPIINLIPHHSKLQWKFYATLMYRLSFNSLIYFNGKIIPQIKVKYYLRFIVKSLNNTGTS